MVLPLPVLPVLVVVVVVPPMLLLLLLVALVVLPPPLLLPLLLLLLPSPHQSTRDSVAPGHQYLMLCRPEPCPTSKGLAAPRCCLLLLLLLLCAQMARGVQEAGLLLLPELPALSKATGNRLLSLTRCVPTRNLGTRPGCLLLGPCV